MTKITAAQKLIEAAKVAGSVDFTVGAGSGNTLQTIKALGRAGYKPQKIGGKWQSKEGMQFRLTIDEEQCDGSRGALCSSQDPNGCDRRRDCPAFAA